jgi:hypothetical protein
MSNSDEDISIRKRKVSSESRIKGFCDVCQLADGKRGFNLQQCKECGVCVHDRCYGIVYTDEEDEDDDRDILPERKLDDWTCHPCSGTVLHS